MTIKPAKKKLSKMTLDGKNIEMKTANKKPLTLEQREVLKSIIRTVEAVNKRVEANDK